MTPPAPRKRRTQRAAARDLPEVGSYVLLGLSGVSMPRDWQFGFVQWVDGEDVLVRKSAGGKNWNQLHPLSDVRAIGPVSALLAFRDRAAFPIKDLTARVDEASSLLGEARAAVWRRLDEIGTSVPRLHTFEDVR